MRLIHTSPGARRSGGAEGNGGRSDDGERLARALGVFSVGLGLAQILAPHGVARAIGVDDDDENRKTMRAVGFREIATGVGLLTRQRPAPFAWGRVTGDAMDLAMLGRAFSSRRNDHNRLAAATAAVAGVTILDIIASQRLSRAGNGTSIGGPARRQGIRVRKAITINRPPEEVYAFWRNLENLPRFMAHLESVRVLDDRRSYWKVAAPLGTTVEWTAEIIEDRPNELIAWRSLEDAEVPNSGTVRFTPAPGGRGHRGPRRAEVRPARRRGRRHDRQAVRTRSPRSRWTATCAGSSRCMETGEVVHSDASIHAAPHPARRPRRCRTSLPGAPRGDSTPQGGFE